MKNRIQKLKNQIIMKLGGVTRRYYEDALGKEWAKQVNLESRIDELNAQNEATKVELEYLRNAKRAEATTTGHIGCVGFARVGMASFPDLNSPIPGVVEKRIQEARRLAIDKVVQQILPHIAVDGLIINPDAPIPDAFIKAEIFIKPGRSDDHEEPSAAIFEPAD